MPIDKNKYIFYAFDKNDPIKTLDIKFQNTYELIQTPTIKTALGSPRDIIGLIKLINHRFYPLKKINPDVFVQFDFTLGIPRWKKTKTIVVGYDLIPLIMKNEYLPSVSFALKHSAPQHQGMLKHFVRSIVFRLKHKSFAIKKPSIILRKPFIAMVRSIYYRLKYRLHYKVFKRADRIVAISESTAEDFINILGVSRKKVSSIPLAPVLPDGSPDFSISRKISKPYVFYIGGTDSRKKIQDIIYAFNIAKGRGADIALVLAGNEFSKLESLPNVEGRNAILKSPYRQDIHLVGFVSDAQKMGLYKSAHAFIFCTIYEGFGLPIIEAMSASCPVISYNNSSIPETAGNAALLVDTGDYVAIANKIIALEDKKLKQVIIEKGIKQANKFNWKIYVTEFKKVLTGIAPAKQIRGFWSR
ncbi:glycosyltransferase family 4 protein [Candidatus Saccharibacteria bacterium]|nr:glycosyltransferase family 4 protein [Candidatus Saccharibacteria bacterium]MBI3337893.1 glycosyltransferase family 4 protein [Candidatus Saccharibacteria bacterium]